MKQLVSGIHPQIYARVGGVAYLIIIILGLMGEIFIRGKMIEAGDATATVANLAASPLAWRLGIAGDLVMHICDVILTMVFYVLFKPVNKNLALLAVLFNLVQTAVLVANKLNLLTSLFLTGNADYLKAFNSQQLQAMAYLSIKMHDYGFGIGLIYFAFTCLIIGFLIIRSGFMPSIIGVFMGIAGICYLINSFALLLNPTLAKNLFPFILAPAFIGELSLCLWLLIKGVNQARWEELTSYRSKQKRMDAASS
jgi:hypothetical protein